MKKHKLFFLVWYVWEDNLKLDFSEGVDGLHMAQDKSSCGLL